MTTEGAKTDTKDIYGLLYCQVHHGHPQVPPSCSVRVSTTLGDPNVQGSIIECSPRSPLTLLDAGTVQSRFRLSHSISVGMQSLSASVFYLQRNQHSTTGTSFYRYQALINAIRCDGQVIVHNRYPGETARLSYRFAPVVSVR